MINPFNSKITLLDLIYRGKTKNIVNNIDIKEEIRMGIKEAAFSGLIKSFLFLLELIILQI